MPDEAHPPALTELAAGQTRGDFGRLLSRLRRSAGRSIREVSAATRIPVATLGDYFNGKHLPPARERTLERILEACGVTGEETVRAWLAALERVHRRFQFLVDTFSQYRRDHVAPPVPQSPIPSAEAPPAG